ncbi:hypothetical protein MVEN_01921900 [Mycena venus]|uniref:Uncharacterized protein n=1 Tax=Mycena venus TaxID=2733690 RepID=A0A8H6XGJ5_9AGAR|nr:hypothetical protein MVEN_01921900 [Mycena venus]
MVQDSLQAQLDTPAQLAFERSFYIGSYVTAILYGMFLFMFFLANYSLLSSSTDARKESFFLHCLRLRHAGALDHRVELQCGLWATHMRWRFSSSTRVPFPVQAFFAGDSVSFGVPYFWMTISLNIITTSLICGRLLAVRSRVRSILGEQYCQTYTGNFHLGLSSSMLIVARHPLTGVVAVLLESALPFTILGIVYVISYARNSPYSFAFLQIWADFCAISPQLIILRVAMGKAWSKDTVASVSVLVFDHRVEKGMNDSGNFELGIALPHANSQGTELTTVDTPSTKGRAIAV